MTHPGTSTFMIIMAEKVLTLTRTTLLQIVSNHEVSAPGPSKFVIIAETVLTWSWTMLFETVCKCKHNPLQDHRNL